MTEDIIESITEIQTRLAFQEKAINDMDDVIISQRDMIDLMHKEIKMLLERIESLEELQSGNSVGETNEKPPHY